MPIAEPVKVTWNTAEADCVLHKEFPKLEVSSMDSQKDEAGAGRYANDGSELSRRMDVESLGKIFWYVM